MKTREEIRATTTGKIPRPENYRYGQKLQEWDATLPAAAPDLLSRIQCLLNDRILVTLLEDEPKPGAIVIVGGEKQLIGGACRKAKVLKTGPGKWQEGGWWKVDPAKQFEPGDVFEVNSAGFWQWFPGERRPVAVHPGQTVYIGNWVDLEADGLALCQEGDVRGYV